jgi:hypothetical protein
MHVLFGVNVVDVFGGFGAIDWCFHDLGVRCQTRISDTIVLELHCVIEAITSCFFDVALVHAVVFW